MLPGGRSVRLATSLGWSQDPAKTSPFPSERTLPDRGYWSTRTGLGADDECPTRGDLKPGQAGVPIHQEFPFVLAAVDPEAEARLAGLEGAMAEGRYLRAKTAKDDPNEIPLIAASAPYADQRDEVVIRRLPAEAAEKVARGVPAERLLPSLAAYRGEEIGRLTLDAGQAYETMLDRWSDLSDGHYVPLTRYWGVRARRVPAAGGTRARRAPGSQRGWGLEGPVVLGGDGHARGLSERDGRGVRHPVPQAGAQGDLQALHR